MNGFQLQTAVLVSPVAAPYSCGSFCWSCWPIAPVRRSYHGRATTGNSSSRTRMKWPAGGACGRTNPKWTMKNWAAVLGITTTRISYIRRPANVTCTNLFAISKAFLGEYIFLFIYIYILCAHSRWSIDHRLEWESTQRTKRNPDGKYRPAMPCSRSVFFLQIFSRHTQFLMKIYARTFWLCFRPSKVAF